MTVETFDVSTDVISVTPEAAAHLKTQVEAKGVDGVRISVKESGCTGYASSEQRNRIVAAISSGRPARCWWTPP